MEFTEGFKLLKVQDPQAHGAVFAGGNQAVTIEPELPDGVAMAGEGV